MRLRKIRDLGYDGLTLYRCACGKKHTAARRDVLAGKVKSCGCLNDELRLARNFKHGEARRGKKSVEYILWSAMIRRCLNKNDEYYGKRGIKVCRRWKRSFVNFLEDVGRRPRKNLTLERINNDKGYSPTNVRWATWQDQAANRRAAK